MKSKLKSVMDSVRLEMSMRFIVRVLSFINPKAYESAIVSNLVNVEDVLLKLKDAITVARANLVTAMQDKTYESSDVEQARMARDTLAKKAYKMLRVIVNNVQSYLLLNDAITDIDEARILSDIFPFGYPSAVKNKLSTFSVVFSTVIAGLEKYPEIKDYVEFDKLLSWLAKLEESERNFNKEFAEVTQAHQDLVKARAEFDRVWTVAKEAVGLIVRNHDLSNNMITNLFADRDPMWNSKSKKVDVLVEAKGTDDVAV